MFVVYVKDFELGTKIAGIAANLNKECLFPDSFSLTPEVKYKKAELFIIDLDEDWEAIEDLVMKIRSFHPQLPVMGFFSSVQKRRHKHARELGCTWVLPRSSFVKNLQTLIEKGIAIDG